MAQRWIERQRVEEARLRIADVDGVQPAVRDREERRAVGLDEIGLVDALLLDVRAGVVDALLGGAARSASSRRSRPGRAESRGRRGRRAGARSPSRRRGAGRTSRRRRDAGLSRSRRRIRRRCRRARRRREVRAPRAAARRRPRFILLCIRHEAATSSPAVEAIGHQDRVDVLVLAPVVVAAQALALEAECARRARAPARSRGRRAARA